MGKHLHREEGDVGERDQQAEQVQRASTFGLVFGGPKRVGHGGENFAEPRFGRVIPFVSD